MSSATFLSEYTAELCRSLSNNYRDNFDHVRFDHEPAESRVGRTWVGRIVYAMLRRLGLQPVSVTAQQIDAAIAMVHADAPQLDWLYAKLADDESRSVLIKVLAFRALGHRKVRLPLSTPEFWRTLKSVEAAAIPTDKIPVEFQGWDLSRIDLRPLGVPIRLYSLPMGAYIQFFIEQYRCRGTNANIETQPGDFVIDGGGCWGDTALYFANKTGASGRVFTFEFVPANLTILRRNLELNPTLKDRVTIVEHALWSKSGERITYEQNGPATRLGTGELPQNSVETLSIDDLVSSHGLSKLDFIKLDIEGAELPTLRGAEKSLRRFKPALAIAVYHSLEEFHSIPRFLDSLGLGYRFHLRHFTIHAEETILFARADA